MKRPPMIFTRPSERFVSTERGLGAARPSIDLYALAEDVQRGNPRYREAYFEEMRDGGLKFETESGAHVLVYAVQRPDRPTYVVEFSWTYRTQWDERESAEAEVGTYNAPRNAIRRALELTQWSQRDVQEWYRDR